MKPIAWYDPTNGAVSTDKNSPLFTPLGQVWGLYVKEEQEPVAWFSTLPDGRLSIKIVGKPTEGSWEPLYTTPPQRTWVGLTDEELIEAMKYWSDDSNSSYGGAYAAEGEYFDVEESWRYIEAKLKEKNHG